MPKGKQQFTDNTSPNFAKQTDNYHNPNSKPQSTGHTTPLPLGEGSGEGPVGSASSLFIFLVSEDGASIYSASPVAREEFPDEDVTTRGAVSIGRRLMDPLAELVKIDPKSIGVGQYQHDVDQSKLKHSLDQTVMSCVNLVGVNPNTASRHLLTYVSGLGPALAQNIIDYRREHGAFTSRAQLRKVKRLGDTAFQQCAGFLRIPNAKNPLDNSAVHPESYHIVEQMAKDLRCTIKDLIGNRKLLAEIDVQRYNSLTPSAPSNSPEGGRVPMHTREDKGALNLPQHLSEVSASLSPPLSGRSGGVPLPLSGESEGALALDIIAEIVSENQQARNTVRTAYQRGAVITSKVIKKMKDTEEAQKFADYFDFSEPLRRCNSHRLLAMRRGEDQGILRVSITIDGEECISRLTRQFVRGHGVCQTLVSQAVEYSFKRLINPSIENEFAVLSKERADEEAIKVFTENLRQLLLSPPLGQKRVLALDPGFANGCKIACLDEQGNLLHHEIIYPHPPRNQVRQATEALQSMINTYKIEAIAIGNGTASRESETFISNILQNSANNFGNILKYVVSEDGASIYSASPVAREEFPDEDVTTRGAISIGRRLMDPLAELVKIDPKSIGVGQYQHDVDQSKLKHSLDQTVMSCVNQVGVNLNTASLHLLTYVSGLGPALARNIIDYRREHGPFTSRAQLKKVKRLGDTAFQQCAGFLRIPNAKNPLDNSAVHPESYHIVEQMAKDLKCTIKDLIGNKKLLAEIDVKRYLTPQPPLRRERGSAGNGSLKDGDKLKKSLPSCERIGTPLLSEGLGEVSLRDILTELEKPGRDPRGEVEVFEFDKNVHTLSDLIVGMELPGIVTNITNFGAFVDIGVHQDGLVHISQLSDRFVTDPTQVIRLHQHVRVRVVEVDMRRKRIALSMKNIKQ